MKAERRHELQTNTLARFLENLPLYFQFHFGKILLGALVLVLIIVLIRYRMTAAAESRASAANGLAAVRAMINSMETNEQRNVPLEQRINERRQAATQIEGTIDEIFQLTEDPRDAGLRAEALIARGDLNWMLANLPPMPGAATQPALMMPQQPEAYLDAAEQAYRQVLQSYSEQRMSAVTAMLGLSAIAENRGQWDAARAQYEAVVKSEQAPQFFRDIAEQRLRYLPIIQQPIYMGELSSEPWTLQQSPLPESIAAPATAPAGQPATQPADPATQPQP